MNYTEYPIADFAAMLGGSWVKRGNPEAPIRHLVTDSRNFQAREGAVFFAIKGLHHNGHRYLNELQERGMVNFVVSDAESAQWNAGVNVVVVNDTIAALQRMAASHRARFGIPVVGTTGSNGKTVVKEWLFQLLQPHKRVLRSPRSYNSQLGVPLSVWHLNSTHEVGVFEAGISQPGEMEHLAAVLQPTIGIFTNIGDAHQEHFQDTAQKIDEKLKLFRSARQLIYCVDHPELDKAVRQNSHMQGTQLLTWTLQGAEADLAITAATTGKGTQLKGTYASREVQVHIPFADQASIENACHCWLYMLSSGHSDEAISAGMAALAPIAMRLEQRQGTQGSVLISDVYNSDFNSLEIALDQLRQQRKNKHYTAIVSDIVQTGEPPRQLYQKLAELVKLKRIDTFIGIGETIAQHKEAFDASTSRFFPTTEAFLADFRHSDFSRQNILIKGARKFAFERITELLSEKTHETVLEIDLEKLRNNFNYMRTLLKPTTKVMVMVKAFAYGSGAYEVARVLEFYGAHYLAVAYADEGFALRESGITLPILVLNPELSSYDAMIRYRLEPQIFSFRTLFKFAEALFARETEGAYPIHIKINTGMNRLGFDPSDMEELGQRLSAHEAVRVASAFSHLAASESPAFDELTLRQVERFELATTELQQHLPDTFLRHLVNSEGIARFPQFQYDMVRLGIALYGITHQPALKRHLKPVSRLLTTVSQLRRVPAGEGVGYSPKVVLDRDTVVAVIPIGYADGLPRALGNGSGGVVVSGRHCPFVGNICMDMAMVDVTDVKCKEGDTVLVFGENISIEGLARQLNTIPYEVLTNISQRVKRVYLQP